MNDADGYPWQSDRGYRPSAQEIEVFMVRHGLTQVATAERAGISRATLIRYLRQGTEGHKDPFRVRNLVRLMRRLDKRASRKEE